ncbi:MAG: PTS sugar transporter subunit IIB [Erysipelotrichaceae bacterium]|nr:PTS sugar transporter subunit IIB [Erysipelotrichaceae bacterium]
MIVLLRIDDRLIHGQVVMGWVKRYSIDHIVAVDDEIKADSFQAKLLKMATPVGCGSDIVTAKQAVELFATGKLDKKRVFIVAKGAKELLELIDAGVEMPEKVNAGNVRQKDGKTVVPYILIRDEDLDNWRRLAQLKELSAQLTPDQIVYDLKDALAKVK